MGGEEERRGSREGEMGAEEKNEDTPQEYDAVGIESIMLFLVIGTS